MKVFLKFVIVLLASELNDCLNLPKSIPEPAQSKIWPNVKYIFPYPIQSPVSIITDDAAQSRELSPLILNISYPWHLKKKKIFIKNTGHYLEVSLPKNIKNKLTVTGGPLFKDNYIFEQFHFHWGEPNRCGSENRLNKACFSTEVHVVFYNLIYDSFIEAVNHPDGVTVVAFFGEQNSKNTDNPDLNYLISKISDVIWPEIYTTAPFKTGFGFLRDIISQQTYYYTFPGSLTTPSYSQCVTWIIFPRPFDISSKQVSAFRNLKANKNGKPLRENIHPLQDFNDRPLLVQSFRPKVFLN